MPRAHGPRVARRAPQVDTDQLYSTAALGLFEGAVVEFRTLTAFVGSPVACTPHCMRALPSPTGVCTVCVWHLPIMVHLPIMAYLPIMVQVHALNLLRMIFLSRAFVLHSMPHVGDVRPLRPLPPLHTLL